MKTRLRWIFIATLIAAVTLTSITPAYALGFLEAVAWSPDGTKIAATFGTGCVPDTNYIAILDATTSAEISRHYSENCYYTALDWSPDGTKLAAARHLGQIHIYDVDTWDLLLVMEPITNVDPWGRFYLHWSPDGTLLANLVPESSGIEIWNSITGEREGFYAGHRDFATDFAWSPDSQQIASTANDNTVQVWNVDTLETMLTFNDHTDAVNGVDWSPDGTRLASVGMERTLRLWDAVTGVQLNVISDLGQHPGSLEWRPFSEQIAIAIWGDNTIQIWDVSEETLIETLDSEQGVPYGLRWSPDGTQLAYVIVPDQYIETPPFVISPVTPFGLTPTPSLGTDQ